MFGWKHVELKLVSEVEKNCITTTYLSLFVFIVSFLLTKILLDLYQICWLEEQQINQLHIQFWSDAEW